MSLMEEFEEDLTEIKSYQPYARRIFWTGANPFAMSYHDRKGSYQKNEVQVGYVARNGACPVEPFVAERRFKLYRR